MICTSTSPGRTPPPDVRVAFPAVSRRQGTPNRRSLDRHGKGSVGRRQVRSRRDRVEDHLHPHRRSAGAGDVLAAADRRAFAGAAGVDVELRDISLAGRIVSQFPEFVDRRAAGPRRPRRARRAGHDARGEHHQAAEHLGVDAPAEGGDRRAAVQGLRPARLPRRPDDTDDETRHPRPATTGSRVRRSTRSCARATPTGGLPRPSRSTPGATPTRWAPGRPTRRRTSRRWAATTSTANERSVTMAAADDLRIEHVAADGTVTVLKASVPVQAGEVVDGTFMSKRGPRSQFLAEQIADAQGAGRAVLAAPQGHDDEGLRPDHLRPRRRGVLRPDLRQVRRRARRGRRRPEQRLGQRARGDRRRSPTTPQTEINADIAAIYADASRPRDGRLRPGHHQPPRPERHHRRRVDAGDDPQLRSDVEQGRRTRRTARPSSPTRATPASTRP